MVRKYIWGVSGGLWLLGSIVAAALQGAFSWELFVVGVLVFAGGWNFADRMPVVVYAVVNFLAAAALGLGFREPAVAGMYALAHLWLLAGVQDMVGLVLFVTVGTVGLLGAWLSGSVAGKYAALGIGSWVLFSGLAGWLLRQQRHCWQQHRQCRQKAEEESRQRQQVEQELAECRQQIEKLRQQMDSERQQMEQQRKQIAQGLQWCRQAMEQLAEYKLGFHLPKTGEAQVDATIESIAKAERNLSMVVLYYQSLANNLANSAEAIARHSGAVQQFLEEQLGQISEFASAVGELSATAEELAKTVGITAEISKETAQQAQEGQRAIVQAIDEMKAIIQLVQHTVTSVQALSDSSTQINAVVQVIGEIAEQINLLALNAAIEAARAGEAGKGFSVVAEEVHRLAERTREATREIAEMIERVHSQTQRTVDIVTEGNAKAEAGIHLAENAGNALEQIVSGVAKVNARVEQIATAVQQQAGTTSAMSQNIAEFREQLSEVDREIVKMVQEQETLTQETKNLREVANEFDVGEEKKNFIEITRRRAEEFAKECARILEEGIRKGVISEEDLFDRTYEPIPNTNPQKYHTKFDWFTDQYIQDVEEKYLAMDKRYRFAILVDDNGYVPSHNLVYSQPLTGDYQTDLVRNRTKRIFDDPTGIRAARNRNPYLLQTYRRDTGEFMNDLSVPVYVRGKHWGAVRIGFVFEAE